MKRVILIFIFLLISFVFVFYFFYQKNKQLSSNNTKLIYNNTIQQWEQYQQEDPVDEDREQILEKIGNDNGAYNPSVLKGYFDNYNEKNQELTIKTIIPFSQNNLFKIAKLKLFSNQTIYCTPEIYTDPNTGEEILIKNLTIPVKNEAILWIPTERLISFEEFITKSNDRIFIFLQLTKDYNQEEDNYIKKLIVVGLCE